eukprot:422443_1
MEIDSFVDCECCFSSSICCISSLSAVMINWFSNKFVRYGLVIGKFGGVILDIMAIMELTDNIALMVVLIIYNIIDRGGALFMMCSYGCKPTKKFEDYAYFLEASGKIKNKEGILSLYYGSLFSVVDFMGQVWKSYTFAIKVDARKISDRKRTKNNLDKQIDLELGNTNNNKNTTVQMTTVPSTPQVIQLPPGWSARVNSDGRVYYQNETTQKTQWDIPVVIPVKNNTENTEQPSKLEHATTDNHTSSVCVFACFYIVTLTILMMIIFFIAGFSFLGDGDKPSSMAAFLLVLSTTANAAGLLQHFVNILTGTVKKCKANKKNKCCVCCGVCFGTIIVIIGIGMFVMVEAILISAWLSTSY